MKNDDFYTIANEIRILATIIAKLATRDLEHRPDLCQAGVGGLQYRIMRMLSWEEQTISELSHKFLLDPSTLVPAVDALERKGLVKRGKDPKDRRRTPLSLTGPGLELVRRVPVVASEDALVKSLKALDETQYSQLLELLRELVKRMPEGKDILQRVSSRVPLQSVFQKPATSGIETPWLEVVSTEGGHV